MNNTLAPIALFVYNRPDLLQNLLSSLKTNPEAIQSDLHVFSDGLKETAALALEAREGFAEVRRMIKTITGFRSVTLHLASQNKGLATSIIDGVTEIVTKYKSIIVLEDDLVLSNDFLQFMNRGLEVYQNNPQVASIHGYNYPGTEKLSLPEVFFYRGADCWGWATWERAWKHFEPDASALLAQIQRRRLGRTFNPGLSGPFLKLLQDHVQGKVDSWAIRWHASTFLQTMFTLYPKISLVNNNGFDKRGTHCQSPEEGLKNDKLGGCPDLKAFPKKVQESQVYTRFLYKKWNSRKLSRSSRKANQILARCFLFFKKIVRQVKRGKEKSL